MFAGPDGVAAIYRRSKKPKDSFFNEWICRPPAAVLVYALRSTRLTPNQVTFASLLVSLSANATLLLWRSHAGLLLAAFLLHAAFTLDCVDGQLARIRGTASAVGGLLDFLMDEIKAVALVASVAGRLAWQGFTAHGYSEPMALWLSVGLVGVVVVSTGISLTTFMRRPEYLQTGRAAPRLPGEQQAAAPRSSGEQQGAAPSLLGKIIAVCEAMGRAVVHYPQWFWLPAVLNRIDWFLLPYLVANLLYLGRASLAVLWRLGR